MTLQEANNFFEGLKNETANKSEIKLYEKFIYILNGLTNREFSEDEVQSIERELDSLNLQSQAENSKKHFRKALNNFEKFLKNRFSLTSKDHYTRLGIGLGISFGILFGVVVLTSFERSMGISLGLSFGMLIGLSIGRSMDVKAKREDRVL